MRRTFSAFTLKEAMQLIPAKQFLRWELNAPPRPPGDWLQEFMRRRDSFDLENSESAKMLLIDALLWEIVPGYPNLKVWKAALLETDELTGVADYLITPKQAYVSTPLLCVAEAKRDDFVQGRTQCLAEMVACARNNEKEGHATDVFGIVSNGQTWQFYRLTRAAEVFETDLYVTSDLPKLLGALDYVCAECARSVP